MKRLIPIMMAFCFATVAQAQSITKARFILSRDYNSFRAIELELNNHYLVGISSDGDLEYIETLTGEELFEGDCERQGIPIKYYTTFDIHDIPGRLKSIGNIKISYNNTFDIHDINGTLKSIGNIPIKYYNTFDIHDPTGKVKSVGNVSIKYFNPFDINRKFGEIKSIAGNSSRVAVTRGRRGGWD